MISTGHYLATAAGARILQAGGNAVDAGVAAGFCINVVQSDLTNLGGVAPIMIFQRRTGRVETISGLGWWPARADRLLFEEHFGGRIPPGIHRCVVPAAVDAWLTALELYGSLALDRVIEPAIELARDGFPMHWLMHETVSEPSTLRNISRWPGTAAVFLGEDGNVLPIGSPVVQPTLAKTLARLAEASRVPGGRQVGIRSARQLFYAGDIADEIAAFCSSEDGWLSREDLAEFRVDVEPAYCVNYHGYDVYGCGPWCQGLVVLQALNVLEGYPLSDMAPGSVGTYHLILESLKAAFADRDRYCADPRFVAVPCDGLLSKEYAAAWRARIDPRRASPGMPQPGDAWAFSAAPEPFATSWQPPTQIGGVLEPDTSYVCAVDDAGNAFSATPSDGAIGAPLIPSLGIMVSNRGVQSWVDPKHPCCLAPRKRPRLTPNPGLVIRGRDTIMPYGTPGLDVQPQAMLQFLVNLIDFRMETQAAVEAPRAATYSFPASSDPHAYFPGFVALEGRVPTQVAEGLETLGHSVTIWPQWTGTAGCVCAANLNPTAKVIRGVADPRRPASASGW
ncbi:MAG: gamma-glutamyltransferase family protein [Solirubrobacteraceae bacterium]